MLHTNQMEMTSSRWQGGRARQRPCLRVGDSAFSLTRSRGRRRARRPALGVFCLFLFAGVLGLETPAAWSEGEVLPAGAGVALTRVTEIVDADVVILGAGRLDGLTDSARVMLLREGDPIVHPLTGQVLGTPQEPVGTVRVFQLQDRFARARLESVYSVPAVDDLAEFEKSAVPGEPAPAKAVAEARAGFADRVKELEASVQQYEKSREKLKSYPTFARQVWDQLTDMRSRLEALDARLVQLEEQQLVDRLRLNSAVSGEYIDFDGADQRDLKEITVKYSPDMQLEISAEGKILFVVNDSLRLEESAETGREQAGRVEEEDGSEGGFLSLLGLQDDDGEGVGAVPGDEPWYKTRWHLAGGAIGLVLALTIVAVLVIRRRYGDVMEGMEEFEDEYLDDEDDEDDEDDDDEYEK